MRARFPISLGAGAAACVLAAACGTAVPAGTSTPAIAASAVPASGAPGAPVRDWPEFGFDPQRSDVASGSTGITAANVSHLHRLRVSLPGTVDSSPVYLHGAAVGGASHDVIVVTTTYGRTLALDAAGGPVPCAVTPPGYPGLRVGAPSPPRSHPADPASRV